MSEFIRACRLCGAALPEEPVLRRENVPRRIQHFPTQDELADDTGTAVGVYQCPICSLVQLNTPPVVYSEGPTSTTAFSAAMIDYRRQQMRQFLAEFELDGKRVLDVGCGDGHLLEILEGEGASATGIDASQKAVELARQKGLNVRLGHIGGDYRVEGGPFDAVVSTDVIEHVPDVRAFVQGIAANMREGAVGLIETPSLEMTLELHRIYDFVPDHLTYFSTETLRLCMEIGGFNVLHIERNRDGENLTVIGRRRAADDLAGLTSHVDTLKQYISAFLSSHRNANRRVAIWGASLQTLSLVSLLPLDEVAYVIDSAAYKQGKFTPVSLLPIVEPDTLRTDPVDVVLVIAPRYQDEIVQSLQTALRFEGVIAALDGVNVEVIQQAVKTS